MEKLHTGLHAKGGDSRLFLFLDVVMLLLVRREDVRHFTPGQAIFCQHPPHLLQFLSGQALPDKLRLAGKVHDD